MRERNTLRFSLNPVSPPEGLSNCVMSSSLSDQSPIHGLSASYQMYQSQHQDISIQSSLDFQQRCEKTITQKPSCHKESMLPLNHVAYNVNNSSYSVGAVNPLRQSRQHREIRSTRINNGLLRHTQSHSNLSRAVAASAERRNQQELSTRRADDKGSKYQKSNQSSFKEMLSSACETITSMSSTIKSSHRRHGRRRTHSNFNELSSNTKAEKRREASIEWQVAVDPKTKRSYYYHPITRQTTWKKPKELIEKEKREKVQFFETMENNIRQKFGSGHWAKNSCGSTGSDTDEHSTPEISSSGKVENDEHIRLAARRSLPYSFSTDELLTDNSFEFDENVDRASAPDALSMALSRPPILFRTISSYETVDEQPKECDQLSPSKSFQPSPIKERIRLVTNDFDKLDIGKNRSDEDSENGAATPRGRRRSNSTGTIFVRMGTMNSPDQDSTIQCVATVIRVHLLEALAAPIVNASAFDLFMRPKDLELQLIASKQGLVHKAVPLIKEIVNFIRHVYSMAQMESECIIMSLIYVERLLKSSSGYLQLQTCNWRCIVFCSMIMASKVWDDLSMCNADFCKIWPELSLKKINELELAYLRAVEYNVRVSAVSYAKYYFHLRSMCACMGLLAAFDESAPLNLEGARKMQVLSEEYQDRSKFISAPRRRSRTVTTSQNIKTWEPEGESASGNGVDLKRNKPGASLEQLVHMEVRSAGGFSLNGMHRAASSLT